MITILPPDLVPQVNSEVRKVITLPPSRVIAGVLLGVALIANVAAAILAGPADPKGQPATGAATNGLYLGLALVTIAAAVFGAVGSGGEYYHRTLPVTALFAADRDRLAAAKFLVAGAIALVTALVVDLISVVVLLILGSDKVHFTGELFGVLGGGLLAAVCWAVIGTGLGLLVRSASTAIWLLIAWLLIVEPLLWLVTSGLDIAGIVTLFPGSATIATLAVGSFPDSDFLAPSPAAIVVLLLWTVGIGAAGWWMLRTRDL